MEHLTRQADIIPSSLLNQEIHVIGCGAIGAFTILNLTKMGFLNIKAYDFDEVSIENMNCQWYRMKDIGRKKTEALRDLILDFTNETIEIDGKFLKQDLSGIVISSVDSMDVRKSIWKKCIKNKNVRFLIDPRMASEAALMYVMDPNVDKDIISYENCLYSDENSVQERCTHKATMYTATLIAGHVTKAVKDIVLKDNYSRITHWNIKTNYQKTWGLNESKGSDAGKTNELRA